MRRTRPGDTPAVRIEADNEWAWCGERRLELAPGAFALLRHPVEHPQRLITKMRFWVDQAVAAMPALP
jgi:hypothetical protein